MRSPERRREDDRATWRSVPATEWIRVTSSASSRVSGGRMPGRRRPSIVLPVPGGPASSMLCSPAAAISSARRPRSWPTHLGEIGQERLLELVATRRRGERDVLLAAEIGGRLGKVVDGDDVDPGERRLGRRLGGAEEELQARATRALGDGDRARDRPDPAVERELTDARRARAAAPAEAGASRREGRGRSADRSPTLLPQRCRSEVDGDPMPLRPRQHRVDDPAVDSVLRLLARTVGKPDDRERRQVGRDEVGLDLDAARLEADDGGGESACQHTFDGTGEPCRVCAEDRMRTELVARSQVRRAQRAAATRIDS